MSNNQNELLETHDLGGGLIARWSTIDDIPRIAHLLGQTFRSSAEEEHNVRMADQAHLTTRPGHPFAQAHDWILVEDTSLPERPVVACTCYWKHTWSYAGISFGVGRPEFVATNPAYRNRGLVRTIFNMLHARSDGEGHLMQGITGIPYFYRQFGYEMVLDLGGGRTSYVGLIPKKEADEPEPYTLRAATIEDAPTVAALYNHRRRNSLFWHEVPEKFWREFIAYWSAPDVVNKDPFTLGYMLRVCVLVDQHNEICASALLPVRRSSDTLYVRAIDVSPELDLHTATPALLRLLRAYGEGLPTKNESTPPLNKFDFNLGRTHPLYDAMGQELAPHVDEPYAWYIRVPDVPAFIRRIQPVLEQRLADSNMAGFRGELKLDFYRGRLRMAFEAGKITAVEAWKPPTYGDNADGGSPPLLFLHVLLSYRSVDEVDKLFPDFWVNNKARQLLRILFPPLPSKIDSLG
ncbi:MAG: GNAT family N-acetyltransferase [Caldilineaceae bacterium]